MKKIKFLLIYSAIVLLAVFCFFKKEVLANEPHLVINEIMTGQADATKNEFIELYNPTSNAIDLTGFTLKKKTKSGSESVLVSSAKFVGTIPTKGYFLISHPDYQNTITADLPYSSSSYSIADNNTIILYDQNNNIIDKVGYGEAFDFETVTALNPDNNQSLERKSVGQDTDDNSLDFIILNTPTPQSSKTQTEIIDNPVIEQPSTPEPEKPAGDVYLPNDLVINEFVSQPNDDENEWIELYSNSKNFIKLDNWIIEDGTGKTILTLFGLINQNELLVFELSSAKLNNGGDIIVLKDPTGKIINQVSYGNWDDGKIDDNATLSQKGGSIARLVDGKDSGNNKNDFGILDVPTKNSLNGFVKTNTVTEKQNTSSGAGARKKPAVPGSVVISELVSDPADGPEWLELYNKTNQDIDLTDWSIEEGSEQRTLLDGILKANNYLVIEKINGNLNNSGDIVILFDHYHNNIDQITYGNWDDSNILDNAPKSSDPDSLSRVGNSQDTNNDLSDWQVSSTPTPGVANILFKEEEVKIVSNLKNKIIITEIFPNPVGSDDGEFIELQNISQDKIDLTGLLIADSSSRIYEIDGTLSALEYFVINRSQSKIALNNSGGDKVVLFDQEKNIIDQVEYKEKADEGKSYSFVDNKWQWTDQLTPATKNIFIQKNQSPVINLEINQSELLVGEELVLDASDSYDPEGKNLILEWQLDDQLYHDSIWKIFFNKIGDYKIKLTASDGENKSIQEILIRVLDEVKGSTSNLEVEPLMMVNGLNLINEILPNPAGSDSEEFIELFNSNNIPVDLSNFFLDDEDGGSKPYQIGVGTILNPFDYLSFYKKDTKLSLNNSGDVVRLLDSEKNILDLVSYDQSGEGESFSKSFDGEWFWTKEVTPDQENKIIINNLKNTQNNNYVELEFLREMDLGDFIQTSGVVVVEPSVLGSQFFYINQKNFGVQIYSNKKDFPKLKTGDVVNVSGMLSQSGGEYRLKIKEQQDIEIIGRQENLEPILISNAEISNELEGVLVQVDGEIIEITGSNIFLDNGNQEVKIYLKKSTGINKKNLKEGDIVSVIGVLNQTSSGFRILPRYQDDIKKVQVLGVEIGDNNLDKKEIIIEPRKNDWLKYIAVTLGAIVVVLLVVSIRMYRKKD